MTWGICVKTSYCMFSALPQLYNTILAIKIQQQQQNNTFYWSLAESKALITDRQTNTLHTHQLRDPTDL